MNITFQKDTSKIGCSCEDNAEDEDFIYLCRKCGGGYIFESGVWKKKFNFTKEAMDEIFLLLNS